MVYRARVVMRSGLFALMVLIAAGPTMADILPVGAAACSGCHAPVELGGTTIVPSLSGRPAQEIVEIMAAFRSGEQPATVMDRIVKGFLDDEIRAIAEWLAAGPN